MYPKTAFITAILIVALASSRVVVAAIQALAQQGPPLTLPELPLGITRTTLSSQDLQGMPGVMKVMLYRVQVKPGKKWTNLFMRASTWDFCYELAGEMTMEHSDGTLSTFRTGTSFILTAKSYTPVFSNQGAETATYICWEFIGNRP